MKHITGIILAGGKNSRMGEDKCFVRLGNKSFLQYLIKTLSDFGVKEIIINTNQPEKFKFSPHSVCCDIISGKGPLGGIYSALRMSKTAENIVLPCDSPFVSIEVLEVLLANNVNHEISFPKFKDKIYPLIGCYKKNVSAYLKSMIDEDDLKVRNLILYPGTSVVDLKANDFTNLDKKLANINDKQTLAYYEKRM